MNLNFRQYLENYNQSFYDKNIEWLKEFYDTDNNVLVYFDNHNGNDSYTTEHHLELIKDFFENGKQTEAGEVEPLIIEKFHTYSKEDAACLHYIARYRSFPEPGVRVTMYLEKVRNMWKILHVHCSFEP